MNKKEKGFTLIDSLVTLFILSLLTIIPIFSIEKITESIQTDLFFRELTSSITLMQNHALLADERTEVQFYPEQAMIRFKVYNGTSSYEQHPLDHTLYLDSAITTFKDKKQKNVTFRSGSGNISIREEDGWTIYFNSLKGEYALVFQIGSGRFEVRQNE